MLNALSLKSPPLIISLGSGSGLCFTKSYVPGEYTRFPDSFGVSSDRCLLAVRVASRSHAAYRGIPDLPLEHPGLSSIGGVLSTIAFIVELAGL